MKPFLLIYLFAFCVTFAAAQNNHRFIAYNVASGLSQNSVHCIYQDRDGMLWLGTQDGLNSFDGRNFKHYKYNAADSNTISDQFVLSVTEDAAGFLWVGTRSGLNRFNKRTGKFERMYLNAYEKKIIGSAYTHLAANNAKEILVPRGAGSSVINKEGKLLKIDSAVSSLSFPVFDAANKLWGVNQHGELCNAAITGQQVKIAVVSKMPFTNSNAKYRCLAAADGIIWCYPAGIAAGNIYFFNSRTKQWLNNTLPLPSPINHIMVAKNGTAWLSTITGLYTVADKKMISKISSTSFLNNELPAGNILCTYEDRQQNIWAGSANGGFAYYNPAFDNYSLLTTSTANEAITTVADVTDNIRWLGSANGLYQMKKNDGAAFTITQKLFSGSRIAACVKDADNNLWAAVQNDGLYIVSAAGKIIKTYKQDDSTLQTKNILYLMCDSKGRVHVCTEKGFFVFTSADKWVSHHKTPKDTSHGGYYVLHCFEDKQKNIWYSKHIGVEVLDENLQHTLTISSGYNSSPIQRSIVTGCTQDDAGNIWIATLSNGLYRFANKQLRQYSTTQGLSSNVIYGVVTDKQGRLWATTTAGINVYVPQQNRFYTLNTKDGLPADDYVLGAVYKNNNGQILVGSSKGLITINTANIVLQNKTAAAHIADVKLNGESVAALIQPLLIAPGNNTVSFDFAIREALQPRSIIYQYRMKGVDDNWIILQDDNHSITYTNLPYKKLTMQVRAAYAVQDLPNAAVEEFVMVLQPPFWKTNWFMLLVLLVIAGIAYVVIHQINLQRKRKRLQQLQVQKQLQQERERISRDLHDNIGAYTSALIAGINRIKAADETNDELKELSEYAGSIMGYLRETIWVLNNEHITLTAFTDRFKNYATRIVKNYPALTVVFKISIETERELSPQQSLNLFRIMQEALQNACKHAQAAVINIAVSSTTKIEIAVADDGKGLLQNNSGDSYGLQNMQQRAAEINFTLQLLSQQGTTVLLTEK